MIKINIIKSGVGAAPSSSGGGFFEKLNLKSANDDGDTAFLSSSEPEGNNAIKVLLMLAGIGGLVGYENYNIPILQQQRTMQNKVLDGLKIENEKVPALVEEINRFKVEKAKLEEQIKTIEDLSRNRMRVVKALDVIQTNVPTKLWINRVRLSTDRLTIDGKSMSDAEISALIDSLSKSVLFSEVNLINAEDDRGQDKSGPKLKRFSIECLMERADG